MVPCARAHRLPLLAPLQEFEKELKEEMKDDEDKAKELP